MTTNEDEHYGTKYFIKTENINIKPIKDDIKLPEINKYLSLGDNIIKNNMKNPEQINKNYLYQISKFNTPDVNILVHIYLPTTILSCKEYIKTLVYFSSILLNIGYEKYMCESARYTVDMSFDMGKLNIEIQGNYEKIHD